jgi:hypothetical protein
MPAAIGGTGTSVNVGWLNLPAGTTTQDPSLHIIQEGDRWATDKSPQLYGTPTPAWSSAINGWVPAPVADLAPDGIHYAFLDNADGKIHIGNAQSGQEAIIDNPNKLTPIAYTSAGVVLTEQAPVTNGLWLLDPATQTISAISAPTGNYSWLEVANGYGWGLDSPGVLGYPASKKVITAQIVPNPQVINPTNTATVAYTAPSGDTIANIAADSKGGALIVLVGGAPGLVYLPPGGSATPYQLPPGLNVATIGPLHHADAHGIWFTGNTGVYLFNTTTGVQKVSGHALDPAFVPAGDCV